MRRVTGKQIVEMNAADFGELLSRHQGVVLDVGTGDGKHAYHVARRRPDDLVIGLDAAKDNLRKIAAKASAKPAKGGQPNLLYVWAGVERLPAELRGVTEIHVLMPWGSLLRGMLGSDLTMLRDLAAICVPDAEFLISLNLHAWRPSVPEVGEHPEPTPESALRDLAPVLAAQGWRLDEAEYLDAEQIDALATSWTRRLNSSRDQLDVLALRGVINATAEPAETGQQPG
ncbi:16S rRNA (adenine(1408)-N(1))-methyltransferase KamB [Actinoalloteichus hymeniacidonis]|uniref:Methyltransferase n=1 Tax=Actinoalloteichus hymeniacidonis TaxID=340345 RepID=A0AAC9MWA0_9PSEU|nr:16S rRNA (adenine(1408)-N(1))-methyltransferase KamB [Actinoalloteichus hymeniacidonis]AOS61993.1 Putative methyltransferase [Actinoalloteichus hymeniacidonis]MBB5909985.1 16S rRNA (adenine(1408)-N(1))-methyltransferase [Actinoalloteichus hymeniacidonis]